MSLSGAMGIIWQSNPSQQNSTAECGYGIENMGHEICWPNKMDTEWAHNSKVDFSVSAKMVSKALF